MTADTLPPPPSFHRAGNRMPLPDAAKQYIVTAHAAGHRPRDIAAVLGCTRQCVNYHLAKARPAPTTPATAPETEVAA